MTPRRQGRRSTTIYSVAKLAGVSIATVSRVLQGSRTASPQARANVLRAVEDLDYVPLRAARSLAVQRHAANGLVVPDLVGPYHSELLMGYESAAAQLGQSVVLVVTNAREDPTRAVRELSSRVDGLVVALSTISDDAARSIAHQTPVVLLARPAVAGCDAVSAENTQSSAALTEHLLAHGRRRLLFVGDPEGSPDVEQRYAGFLMALSKAETPAAGPALRVSYREASGAEAAAQVLASMNRPDALVCANDRTALGMLDVLVPAGVRVPEDVIVTGFDGIETGRLSTPRLTTVYQPMVELGRTAIRAMLSRIEHPDQPPITARLPVKVLLRESSEGTLPS